MRKSAKIILKIGDREVGTAELPVGSEPLLVGRSHECALRTPADELSVSGRHARLFWKSGRLYIEDAGSRCGVVSHGKPIREAVRARTGDFFILGHVTLVVSESASNATAATGRPADNALEFVNGREKGRQVPVVPAEGVPGDFTIGLDPGCGLALSDPLVSRHHAVISVREDGTCWIRDTGSKNGTKVNGAGLLDKERMLKDGDIVTIVCHDLRFLDRNVSHTRFHFWVKFVAVVCALALMAALYVLWATSRSSAADYMRLARNHAAAEDFAAAGIALDGATMARDAEKYRPQVEMLREQLERWTRACGQWNDVKSRLAGRERNWVSARALVDQLDNAAMDIWAWNADSASTARQEASFTARALRFYSDAVDVLADTEGSQPEQQAERILAKLEPLRAFVAKEVPQGPQADWFAPLKSRLSELVVEMDRVRAGFAQVDACIGRLDAVNPDFEGLTRDLDAVVGDMSANPTVRAYARKYVRPCRELANAKAFVEAEFAAVTRMEFSSVLAGLSNLHLPDKELCARHARLSDHRGKLAGHHQDVERIATAVAAMVLGLNEDVFDKDSSCYAALSVLLDPTAFAKALAFDCLSKAPPSARRRDPVGTYDRVIGIEFGYESLRHLPEDYDGACLRLVGFRPQVCDAHAALERIAAFCDYMGQQRAWIRNGPLGDYLVKCRQILARRDQVVAEYLRASGCGRRELLLRLCAVLLAPDALTSERRRLAADFKAYQAEMAKLAEAYAETEVPAKQIEIREQILSKGLPGDGAVQVRWAQKFIQ